MSDIRDEWIATMQKYRLSPDRPDNDRFWCTELDTAPREKLRAIQNEKLRVAVRYVYECIPFYRRKFDRIGLQPGDIRSVDDLPLIPVTTKQEMADDLAGHSPWGTYTALDDELWAKRGWQIFASSGTTAQPRAFRYSQFDREMWMWGDARAMWAMGFRPGRDSAMIAFGYGPHVWLWGVHYALNLVGIPIITAGGLDSSARARFIDRYKPTILACTPSYALYLASVMRELGLDPAASSIRYLFCAGEPGFSIPSTRRRLEETWQAELHEFYGCTEAAPSAGGFTCAAVAAQKEGVVSTHLMEDVQVWEVVDEQMHTLPDGNRGLTVVTNLCSEASPQLRFLVGDYTTLTHEPCACGRTHARAVGGMSGRADDMLNVRGVTLFPSSIEDVVRRIPTLGAEFAIVLTRERDLDVLIVQVEVPAEVSTERYSEIAGLVEREIRSQCELRAVIEVLPQGTLPPTQFKAKRVRDLRQQT
ncbi:MAG TPA: AMP-binding protein [Ktedonobacteraceae bacterium]|nr:AMP-binding protein [Ktedonobacteraceae bacterium]